MATMIALRFPWGRYHATPWDHAVNEAVVEWPPSSWRLLRALYSTWRTRAPDIPADVVEAILGVLAEPPAYLLARRSVGHTRHYYPDTRDGTDKVLDPFVVLERGAEVVLRWDADLDPVQRACAARLCSLLGYLGRADSLCDAALLEEEEEVSEPGRGSADPAEPKDKWCLPGTAGGLASPAIPVLVARVPLDVAALTETTVATRKSRRLIPKGARWVPYALPAPASGTAPPLRSVPAETPACTAALLAVDGHVRPSVHDAVWVGHVVRKAALKHFDACEQRRHRRLGRPGEPEPKSLHSAILAGKDRQDAPLRGHGHAHYLPLDLDGDRLIDTVLVWAPTGLDEGSLEALGAIRHLWGPPGFRPLRAALQHYGRAEDLVQVGPAQVWVSRTPFVPYRHQKKQDLDTYLHAELAREAGERLLPVPQLLGMIPGPWLGYRRARPGGRDERGYGLEISFPAPVKGPLALGALAHFGLGQFEPV